MILKKFPYFTWRVHNNQTYSRDKNSHPARPKNIMFIVYINFYGLNFSRTPPRPKQKAKALHQGDKYLAIARMRAFVTLNIRQEPIVMSIAKCEEGTFQKGTTFDLWTKDAS